jgi:hypothetical protein
MPHRFTEPTPVTRAHGTVVEVFVSDWEIECCAPPPSEGERTRWTLTFVPAGGSSPELDRTRTWDVVRHPAGTVLTDGQVVACWYGDGAPAPGHHEVRGHLVGSVHGPAPEGVPAVDAMVQRVQVAAQVFRLDDTRTLRPVAGTWEVRDVRTSPRRFSWGDQCIEPGVDVWAETGVLLDLTVP